MMDEQNKGATNRQDAMEAAWDAANDAASDYEHYASRGMIEAAVAAYLAAREAQGFVMVPVEPSDAMYQAAMVRDALCPAEVYRAMLAARPTNGDR